MYLNSLRVYDVQVSLLKHTEICILSTVAAFCFCLFFSALLFSVGQDVHAAETTETTPAAENLSEAVSVESLVIKLSVNEVRLDVVVLDKKGNPITDLTAADFEVFQDGKQQEVLSGFYIDSQSDVASQSADIEKKATNLPQYSTQALKKEDVRRNIVFLFDDVAMSFENGYYAKMALRNFAEKQMQPGDLVAIIRTDYGNSALNMFYSDKRELLARINALPVAMATKSVDLYGLLGDNVGPGLLTVLTGAQIASDRRNIENLMSNLSYSLRAVKGMPGRKIINTITPTLRYGSNYMSSAAIENASAASIYKLADEALRDGVVINFLGIEGLKNFSEHGADAETGGAARNGLKILYEQSERQKPLIPLPFMTGGVVVEDRNFFLAGLGVETESLMRGYYLISYVPPPNTFEKRGKNDNLYRRLKVRVKRNGAAVHTRDGFFGSLESEPYTGSPKQNPLIDAIYSPFQSTDINVNIVAGYVKDAKAGYLVRSWIHVDPEDVKIVETEDGNRIDLEAIYLTSDLNGNIQESKRVEFTLSSKTGIDWVRKHGIRFSMLLPVKKPGSYYVRVSIQDAASGKVGSAYQFLEIPDIGKKGLALSNMFMITSADDLDWMRSDAAKEISEGVFFPVFQGEVRSPALRTYKSGDIIHTLVMLYNADAKAIARSEIEVQSVTYKDGKEFRRGNKVTITPNDLDSSDNSVPLLRRFTLGSDMPPGDYLLQLVVTDKKNSKKNEGSVAQVLSFTVIE